MRNPTSKLKSVIFLISLLFSLSCSKSNPVPQITIGPTTSVNDTVIFGTTTVRSGTPIPIINDIYIARISSSNQVIINKPNLNINIRPDAIAFSPDRKKFAFNYSVSEKAGIFTMGIDGTNISQLTNFGVYPQWSTDGKWILFLDLLTDGQKWNYTVNALNVESLETYTCPEIMEYFTYAEWIPNSYRILYIVGDPSSSNKFYECDVSNKTGKFIDANGENLLNDHSVSPDGQKIVYSVFMRKQEGTSQTFKVADFTADKIINSKPFLEDGGGSGELPRVDYPSATWSPDSQFFAVDVSNSGEISQSDITIYDIKGNLIKQLTNTPEWSEATRIWSASGKYIVAISSPSKVGGTLKQVVAINVKDGTEIVLARESDPDVSFFVVK